MTIDTLLFTIILILACLFDRFILRRGNVKILNASFVDKKDGFFRFSLDYHVTGIPSWSLLDYQLKDIHRPATVISGKPRAIGFFGEGRMQEFLLLREDMIADGEWQLRVKIQTSAGNTNLLYRLLPITTIYTAAISIQRTTFLAQPEQK